MKNRMTDWMFNKKVGAISVVAKDNPKASPVTLIPVAKNGKRACAGISCSAAGVFVSKAGKTTVSGSIRLLPDGVTVKPGDNMEGLVVVTEMS